MYIVFEGIDGTGKSTQIELVKERLQFLLHKNNYNINITTIAEPELEDIVNEGDWIELALRFALQRRILLDKEPVSSNMMDYEPHIILSDRSFYSSLAYQGYSDTTVDYIRSLNFFVPEPSQIFFLDNGIPDDSELEDVRNNYFNILPLSTVYVNTKKYSITQTTEFITNKILKKWNSLFQNELNQQEM